MNIGFMVWMHGWCAVFLFYIIAMLAAWLLEYGELLGLIARAPFWIGIVFIISSLVMGRLGMISGGCENTCRVGSQPDCGRSKRQHIIKKKTWLKCWFASIGCMIAVSASVFVLGHEDISDTLAMAALYMTIPCFGGSVALSYLGILDEVERPQ